ncbi:hypothetical protein RB653_009737 [Dictyostelium firmibasis]|uniref:Uncharacterized protein n=1 Tax=Dictyostelium firmibasis TaxID=79012 RepID=A0AAN7TKI4_9MYCE
MLTEDKLNKWRLLLITSCLIGIIAPTLIITAFALFDPSIIIVKISILQNYNLNVRRWETIYKKDFSKFKFYLYMNETIGLENSYSESSPSSSSSSSSSIASNDGSFEHNGSNIQEMDQFQDENNSGDANKLNTQFQQSSTADHVSYPTTEMIQLYTPLVFIANTSLFLSEKYTLNRVNFEPYNVTLHLFVRKPSSTHLTYVSKLSFSLFNKITNGVQNNLQHSKPPTVNTTTSLGSDPSRHRNQSHNTPYNTTSSNSNNNNNNIEENNVYQQFENACFVLKDSVIIEEPCTYKSNNFNYSDIKDFNKTIVFNSTFIMIKSYRDPYLLAGTLTEGSYSFAMDKDTQGRLGLAFLIAGCIAFLLFLVVVWIVVKMKRYQSSLDKIDDLNTNSPLEMEEYNNNHVHFQNNNNSINGSVNRFNRTNFNEFNNENNQDFPNFYDDNNNNLHHGHHNIQNSINNGVGIQGHHIHNQFSPNLSHQSFDDQYHNSSNNNNSINNNNNNDNNSNNNSNNSNLNISQQDIRQHVENFEDDQDLISAEDVQRFNSFRRSDNYNNNSFSDFDNHSSISHSRSTNQPIIRNNNQQRYSHSNSSSDLKSSFSV